MEALAAAAFVIALVGIFALLYQGVKHLGQGNVRKQLKNARWETFDYSDEVNGDTRVVVRKAIGVGGPNGIRYEVRSVAQIPNSTSDYTDQLLAARAEADIRASALNSG